MLLRQKVALILLFTLTCLVACFELPAFAADNDETGLSRQLKINKQALMMGPSQQQRVDAAVILLASTERAARKILLAALEDETNQPAREAVCTALVQENHKAKLAAEALLIFEFRDIERYLSQIIEAKEPDYKAILNVMYALRLRPEREAIFTLIELREHKDKAIAATAEKELQNLLGIPAGTDQQTWQDVLRELHSKSRYEFMRDRLVRQEMEVNRLRGELNRCQDAYELSLAELYKTKNSQEKEKAAFLISNLDSEWPTIRLWALEQVRQWKLSGKSLPPDLTPSLAKRISDQDPRVRHNIAKLLGQMGDLNLSEQLAGQIKNEKEDDIRIELLGALGEACYTALALNPDEKAAEKITATRKLALEIAARYISDAQEAADAEKAQKAATTLRKLLEQKGLTQSYTAAFLQLLVDKYRKEKLQEDGYLRGELVSTMAGLCAETADCRPQAVELFRPVFLEVLQDNVPAARRAAVTGFINIDKAVALTVLKKNHMMNDQSPIVCAAVIELAGNVGGQDDLEWLAPKLFVNGQAEAAWTAMRKIFGRCSSDILMDWAKRLTAKENPLKSDLLEYLLQTAEEKAAKENNLPVLRNARTQLAALYQSEKKFTDAARYYGMVLEMTKPGENQDQILASLLSVNLLAGAHKDVKLLVQNRLLEDGDLPPDHIFLKTIGEYLEKNADKKLSKDLLKELAAIENNTPTPMWISQLQRWNLHIGDQKPEPNSPPKTAQAGE